MKYADRLGNRWDIDNDQDKQIQKLYKNRAGRMLMKFLSLPVFSRIGGSFLNTRFSRRFIKPFVEKYSIDLSKCEKQDFKSYNDFFTRKYKNKNLYFDMNSDHLISPCDSKLFVSKISETSSFHIKGTYYTTEQLLQDNILSNEFIGGYALIFRLSVDDYHRYSYFDDGQQTFNKFIKGRLQTVNPIANAVKPIYKENSREISIILTENFGKVVFIEVGALMVGKISNHKKTGFVKRGEEKGMFEFGGSTIIILLKKGVCKIDEDIIKNSKDDYETIVSIGEKIGLKVN